MIFGLLAPLLSNSVDWPQYGNYGGQQYTPLTQITADNLHQLKELWRFRTGDLGQGFRRKGHSMQANPILWNRTLYISTSANWVIAIDAQTGVERWRFDPKLPKDIGYSSFDFHLVFDCWKRPPRLQLRYRRLVVYLHVRHPHPY